MKLISSVFELPQVPEGSTKTGLFETLADIAIDSCALTAEELGDNMFFVTKNIRAYMNGTYLVNPEKQPISLKYIIIYQ